MSEHAGGTRRIGGILVATGLVALVAVPVVVRDGGGLTESSTRQLVILSPHNEQIRTEMGRGFAAWHEERFGEAVTVAWSTPGGTSEIRKMLVASAEADLREGRPVGGNADLLFGGGSYEFNQLSRPVEVDVDGETRAATILEPIDFSPAFLEEVYGDGRVGDEPLYSAEGMWFGVALSGFGIVYNREILESLKVPAPEVWADLCTPKLRTWLVLANPGQSGSVTTAMEAILQRRGWDEGWAILRRMAANSRSFVSSASKAPIEVSLGEAAAGLCIDFYGRYQAQALADAAEALGVPGLDRLGYVDPPGQTVIDPDPIALLRGAPEAALARRFVEFCLSEQGQALWQFHAGFEGDPANGVPRGPERFELRRMPVRRDLYAKHAALMVDRVDPYAVASGVPDYDRSMRAFIAPIFAAFAIDRAPLLRKAWDAIVDHPAYPRDARGLVLAEDVADPQLRAMLENFDAMPEVAGPDGGVIGLALRDGRSLVKAGWLRGVWDGKGLWPPDASPTTEFRRRVGTFFDDRYREVIELGSHEAPPTTGGSSG